MLDTASQQGCRERTKSLWLTISELVSSRNRGKPKCAGHCCGTCSSILLVDRPGSSSSGQFGAQRHRAAREFAQDRCPDSVTWQTVASLQMSELPLLSAMPMSHFSRAVHIAAPFASSPALRGGRPIHTQFTAQMLLFLATV
jgi:hypothetical protein